MSDTKQETCEERVDRHLASRIADLEELQTRMASDDTDEVDEAQEELDNFALSVDLKVTMTVQISTGGPGDQFEIEIVKGDYGWELADDSATYRFFDWGDGATRRTDDPAVMAYLANMVEYLSPEWAGE